MTQTRPIVLLDALFYQDDRNLEDAVHEDIETLAKYFWLRNKDAVEMEAARAMAIEVIAALIWKGYYPPPARRSDR